MKRGFLGRVGRMRGLIVSLLAFFLILLWVNAFMGSFEERSGENQLSLVRDAVRRAAMTCYAVEGYYPQMVKYLKQHYGLVYDEDRYIVSYDAFASNIMPDIRVLVKGANGA